MNIKNMQNKKTREIELENSEKSTKKYLQKKKDMELVPGC
jgi:hypothetical protein